MLYYYSENRKAISTKYFKYIRWINKYKNTNKKEESYENDTKSGKSEYNQD